MYICLLYYRLAFRESRALEMKIIRCYGVSHIYSYSYPPADIIYEQVIETVVRAFSQFWFCTKLFLLIVGRCRVWYNIYVLFGNTDELKLL